MSQPSVAAYFTTRKRSAYEEANIAKAKKVLILDTEDNVEPCKRNFVEQVSARQIIFSKAKEHPTKQSETNFPQRTKLITKLNFDTGMTVKKADPAKSKVKKKAPSNQPDIQKVFFNLQEKKSRDEAEKVAKELEKTPVKNAMDKLSNDNEISLVDIKNKLSRSSRLAELKASIARFGKSADKLKEIEKKTEKIVPQSPVLKTFTTIDLEVQSSPKKQLSPEKSYLSPKKDISSPRKNLLGLLSPTKSVPAYQKFQTLVSPGKSTLTLPYKYRCLAEMFRSIDTVCSIMCNRKEMITFNKIKPAVQEMLRRNVTLKHFSQIKSIYPDAFDFKYEKMRLYCTKSETYELVVTPKLNEKVTMDPTCLLDRRRYMFNALIEKLKNYHNEFLLSLTPPLVIANDKITRWHPEFDIEKVPEIEDAEMPQIPNDEKMTSGQEVLEKARELFNCNTRMERALNNLKKHKESDVQPKEISTLPTSLLKGIPKALLEKVRAKQAAKALEAMTRTEEQDKESIMYNRLPDLARLLRSTYVAEKKGVLPLEDVIKKLNNSYRSHLTNSEIEEHLRELCKVVPGWIVFHEVRNTLFVKVSRDGDMSKVMAKLDDLAKQKSCI